MRDLSREEFRQALELHGVKKSLRAELKYVPEQYDWDNCDFLYVFSRTGSRGVVVFEQYCEVFSYIPAKQTKISSPILCDICRSWLRPTNASTMTFEKGGHSLSYFVCDDLDCSRNVRGLTVVGKHARAQLREDISDHDRSIRLQQRLRMLLTRAVELGGA